MTLKNLSLIILTCFSLNAATSKEEFFVKRRKDNSFCVFKKETVTIKGTPFTRVIPLKKLPEGYIIEKESSKDFAVRIVKKHGIYLLFSLLGATATTEHPKRFLENKFVSLSEDSEENRNQIRDFIELGASGLNSVFLGSLCATLSDVYQGKQPKVVKMQDPAQDLLSNNNTDYSKFFPTDKE